jgi:ABC-type phosphate transport system substrate-binding protein
MGVLSMRRRTFSTACASLLLGIDATAHAASGVALVIIAAPNSKLTQISRADLRRVFTGERITDPDGNKLIALNHPPKTVDRVGFDRAVLGMDAETVARFWIDRRIRGLPGPPRTVESLATLRRVVEKLPGAIGYLRAAQLTAEVRVVRVDDKLPEDPGYPVVYQP